MNQTRTFLIFAWLAVATLLFMAWTREHSPQVPASSEATQTLPVDDAGSTVPSVDRGNVPGLPKAPPSMSAVPAGSGAEADVPVVTITTDVMRVVLDGGAVRQADLLDYPQDTEAGAAPIRLFASDAQHYFQAQSGWVSSTGAAPGSVVCG